MLMEGNRVVMRLQACIAAMALAGVTPSPLPTNVSQQIVIVLGPCDGRALTRANADVYRMADDTHPSTRQWFVRDAHGGGRLHIAIGSGNYYANLHSGDCNGTVFAAVLPHHDRTLHAVLSPHDFLLWDPTPSVAGTLPRNIVAARVWPIDRLAPPIAIDVQYGAYYWERAVPVRNILELDDRSGKKAFLALDLSQSHIDSLTIRNITGSEFRATEGRSTSPYSRPTKIVRDTGGTIWFLNTDGNSVGHIDQNGNIEEFVLRTFASDPTQIAPASGGAWVSEERVSQIAWIGDDGKIVEFPLDTTPQSLLAGADGRAWFVPEVCTCVDAMDRQGHVSEYDTSSPPGTRRLETYIDADGKSYVLPLSDEYVKTIALGPDRRIWFAESDDAGNGSIGTIDSRGKVRFVAFHLQATTLLADDSSVWAAILASNYGAAIARIRPDGSETTYEIPIWGMQVQSMATDVRGVLWFTDQTGQIIGDVFRNKLRERYLSLDLSAKQLFRGPDGNLWMTNPDGSSLSFLGQQFGFYYVRPRGDPTYATVDDHGNIWFTEPDANVIGELRTDGSTRCFALHAQSTTPSCEAGPPVVQISP